jgi:hypothetical protein
MNRVSVIKPSLNEFRVFFNEKAKMIRPELMIKDIVVHQRNTSDSFFIQLNQSDVILGSLSKENGSIHQLALVRKNDGTARSKFEFLISILILLESLKPKISIKKKSMFLERLNFFNKDFDIYNAKVTATYENLSCSIISSVTAGFFSISLHYL